MICLLKSTGYAGDNQCSQAGGNGHTMLHTMVVKSVQYALDQLIILFGL